MSDLMAVTPDIDQQYFGIGISLGSKNYWPSKRVQEVCQVVVIFSQSDEDTQHLLFFPDYLWLDLHKKTLRFKSGVTSMTVLVPLFGEDYRDHTVGK